MSQSKSINNRLAACAALSVLSIAGAGCGRKDASEAVNQTRLKAVVRVDVLSQKHPLQADVARLGEAERRLTRLATQGVRSPDGGQAYDLPPLPSAQPAAGTAAGRARATRREAARRAVVQSAEAQLAAFAGDRAQRQVQLLDQRRSELFAIEADEQAKRVSLARTKIEDEIRIQTAAKTNELTLIRSRIAILDAQLDPERGTLPPVLNTKDLEAEIAQLKADPTIKGISTRARLELLRQTEQALLNAVLAELAAIQKRGAAEAEKTAGEIAAQQRLEIERQLDALRDDAETRFLLRAERAALARNLAEEQAIALRAGQARKSLAAGANSADKPLRFEALFGKGMSVVGGGDVVGARAAAQRVARQKETLLRLIRVDTLEAIRDVAQNRNIDVQAVSGTTEADLGLKQGRKEMTAQFAGWITPGVRPQSGTPNLQGGAAKGKRT